MVELILFVFRRLLNELKAKPIQTISFEKSHL